MITYTSIFIIVLLHLGNAAKLGILRIVNGTTVNIEDYPYQVSLQFRGNHICGGSILNEQFILTAAHCTIGTNPSDLSIRAGSSFRNTGGTVIAVDKIFIHDQFVLATYENDVSILKLSKSLTFYSSVKRISLPSTGTNINDGLKAWATGWGLLYEEGPPADQLQAVQLPTISTNTCKTYYGDEVTNEMFCAGYKEGGKDTCVGDSGGPLVVSGIQIGITSWGLVCAGVDQPGAYVKLPVFVDYIKSIINNN